MKIGMLWFDNSKDSLDRKIIRAITYYQNKFGHPATLCYVHPKMLDDTAPKTEITVSTSKQVLPNHIWVGVKDE